MISCPGCNHTLQFIGGVSDPPLAMQMIGDTRDWKRLRYFCPVCLQFFDYSPQDVLWVFNAGLQETIVRKWEEG